MERSQAEIVELSESELGDIAGGCPLSALVATLAVMGVGRVIDAIANRQPQGDPAWILAQ